MGNQEYIESYLASVQNCFAQLTTQTLEIVQAASVVSGCLAGGGRVFLCGNGGSAADAQHIAAELIGRFQKERQSLPAVALTTDTSAITAIANDYGYDKIFARQLSGLAQEGDLLIAISTSGNSENVLKAVECAKEMGVKTIGLTGEKGGQLSADCDQTIKVPATETCHIQEMHIAIGHMVCAIVETNL